jgi:ribitol-5-phosphate 2-dehydrogenase
LKAKPLINNVYQLVGTRTLIVKFEDISLGDQIITRPDFLAICHADQRYYRGEREHAVLARKLPMAPIHEASATVVHDPTGTYAVGARVVLVPNIVGKAQARTSADTPPRAASASVALPTALATTARTTAFVDTIQRIQRADSAGTYENYAPGSGFRSSGYDGFLSELVALPPDRVVAATDIAPEIAAITEFVSVAAHASTRFDALAHQQRERLAVIGDGSMAYVVANVLKERFPASQVIVLGRHQEKLAIFSFADETWYSDMLPDNVRFDHAFECTGAQGSAAALEVLINHINPQGSILLLGVSEQAIPVNTRMVLEKGLTLIGCSRSGRVDFEQAIALMRQSSMQQRLRQIIYLDDPVSTVMDIKRVFDTDLITPFKTVFEWRV